MKTDSHHRAASFCPNCDTALGANFCPQCGQPAHLHVPSAREFLHEFIAHYVALEGKLWKSLGLLMFKPGRLTRAYIEGRRVPYVEPLRLYLSFSIILFAVFKFGNIQVANFGPEQSLPVQSATVPGQAAPPPADPAPVVGAPVSATTGDSDVDDLLEAVDRTNGSIGDKARRFLALSNQQKGAAVTRAFFSYGPYVIFALMPLFAAYLKLLYLGTGRRYGEHLLFALHTNAFAFLVLSLILVVPAGIPLLVPALVLWLIAYTPLAMQRVYGGLHFLTALRWMTLMTLHFCSMVFAVIAIVVLAVAT